MMQNKNMITPQDPQCVKTSVNSSYSIHNKKPKKGQKIMYKGNLGFSKGTYRNFDKNIGWVILPDGGVDCFDEWSL
jgi:hypothetical protein